MTRKNDCIDKIDKHIGEKIRILRLSSGYARKQLCKTIGVSDQQLQKYELGINRVSVGRLILIAKALGQEVSYFHEGIDDINEKPIITQHQSMCIDITKNFMRIENPEHQSMVNNLIKSLAKVA